jgi:hypothetical protein
MRLWRMDMEEKILGNGFNACAFILIASV